MRKFPLLIIILLSASTVAHGQVVFKCKDETGATVFSDAPCAQDAEAVAIQDSQSGIGGSEIYDESVLEAIEAEKTHRVNLQREAVEAQRVARIEREAQKELGRLLDRGVSVEAAQVASKAILSKIDDPERGRAAQKEFNRLLDEGYSAGAADVAVNAILGQPSDFTKSAESGYPRSAAANEPAPIPATPILSSEGGFYYPTSADGKQYLAPGGGFCQREGSNLNCAGTMKSANGVVIEPPNR